MWITIAPFVTPGMGLDENSIARGVLRAINAENNHKISKGDNKRTVGN
ncbi:hypothetical protein YpAngola_A2170 [Yersinia pestis Angola]|nr:hypothetical protein YpAngola_A2170 [Yersinia pestis Angola]